MNKKIIILFLFGFLLLIPVVKADSYYNVWQTDWKYVDNNYSTIKLNGFEDIYGAIRAIKSPMSLNFSTNIPLHNKPQRVRFHLVYFYTDHKDATLGFSGCDSEYGYCTEGVIRNSEKVTSLLVSMKQEILSSYCEFVANDKGVFTVDCPIVSATRPITGLRFEVTGEDRIATFGVGAAVTFIYEDTNSSLEEQEKTNEKLEELNKNQQATNNALNGSDSDTSSSKCGIICKLKGIFTGIVELPSKLVNLLIDALKSLFVPSNNQLYEIINDSKELSENFGFVGESINFFINIFTSFLGMVNGNGCVEFPGFSIGPTSLFEKVTFWEKQNVCLSDNIILNENIETIRTITSIVLVSLFIGFAASKFFNILSKNDSGSVTSYDSEGNVSGYDWSSVNGDKTIYRR